ncbi:MAG: MHYT domain-containing protein, partial [Janthinobacterium sp.]
MLVGSYNPLFVVLSILVAILASFTALDMASRVSASQPRRAAARWLVAGGVAMGAGIWSMHFVGMLAFDLCLTVNYDLNLSLISMVPSLLASWIALRILSRPRPALSSLLLGGFCVGVGIGAMHYSGMASMRMAPLLRYDPFWFAAS